MEIASPSQSRDQFAMPVVLSVHMASPDLTTMPLTPMDVDYIIVAIGQQNSNWPAQQRLELTTYLWNRSIVVRTFNGWEVGETD